MYAVIFEAYFCKAAPRCSPEGSEHWVTSDNGYNSSRRMEVREEKPPDNIITWDTEAKADVFMITWLGGKWYARVKGPYRVVKVVPVFKTVPDGWELEENREIKPLGRRVR